MIRQGVYRKPWARGVWNGSMLSKKGLRSRANSDSCLGGGQLFYEFSLDEMIPTDHLLRRINVFATAALADLHEQLRAFYGDIGRPSVDPELMIRMLLVGYCYGIRHERRLCQEVALHLAYRWFCKLDLDCFTAGLAASVCR